MGTDVGVEIVVSRDGIWPTVWRWSASVPVCTQFYVSNEKRAERFRTEHLRGEAFTQKRALRNARRATETLVVEREMIRQQDVSLPSEEFATTWRGRGR